MCERVQSSSICSLLYCLLRLPSEWCWLGPAPRRCGESATSTPALLPSRRLVLRHVLCLALRPPPRSLYPVPSLVLCHMLRPVLCHTCSVSFSASISTSFSLPRPFLCLSTLHPTWSVPAPSVSVLHILPGLRPPLLISQYSAPYLVCARPFFCLAVLRTLPGLRPPLASQCSMPYPSLYTR